MDEKENAELWAQLIATRMVSQTFIGLFAAVLSAQIGREKMLDTIEKAEASSTRAIAAFLADKPGAPEHLGPMLDDQCGLMLAAIRRQIPD